MTLLIIYTYTGHRYYWRSTNCNSSSSFFPHTLSYVKYVFVENKYTVYIAHCQHTYICIIIMMGITRNYNLTTEDLRSFTPSGIKSRNSAGVFAASDKISWSFGQGDAIIFLGRRHSTYLDLVSKCVAPPRNIIHPYQHGCLGMFRGAVQPPRFLD